MENYYTNNTFIPNEQNIRYLNKYGVYKKINGYSKIRKDDKINYFINQNIIIPQNKIKPNFIKSHHQQQNRQQFFSNTSDNQKPKIILQIPKTKEDKFILSDQKYDIEKFSNPNEESNDINRSFLTQSSNSNADKVQRLSKSMNMKCNCPKNCTSVKIIAENGQILSKYHKPSQSQSLTVKEKSLNKTGEIIETKAYDQNDCVENENNKLLISLKTSNDIFDPESFEKRNNLNTKLKEMNIKRIVKTKSNLGNCDVMSSSSDCTNNYQKISLKNCKSTTRSSHIIDNWKMNKYLVNNELDLPVNNNAEKKLDTLISSTTFNGKESDNRKTKIMLKIAKSTGNLNDLENFSDKNYTKETTNKLLINSILNNTVEKNKTKSILDFNLKNSENRKFNDLKSSGNDLQIHEQQQENHGIKIIMKNSIFSICSDISTNLFIINDSEKEYGIYNEIIEDKVIPSNEDSLSKIYNDSNEQINSIHFSSIPNLLVSQLGCDGGIFLNNCYFYEENCNSQCINDLKYPNRYRDNIQFGTSTTDLRPKSFDATIESGFSVHTGTGFSADGSTKCQHQQNLEARKLKTGHVLHELLETEKIYVTEMNSILKGYRDQIYSEDMFRLVPPGLHENENILFGNLDELHSFHSNFFLKDLDKCITTTELVALCFVQRRNTFYRLYSFYCQNIPRSERLRETLADKQAFFQECQKRLGHKLPLAAYLLKPVQRIMKYQLILKDLLRFSDSSNCIKELQKALDCMLIVLKCVNDSMVQIAITGFPNDLSQQGELLLQDSFQVWSGNKKDIRLRLKPHQRHIFLHEKAILFCKQNSKTGNNKSPYQFKNYLKMSQIGLTESIRGDPKRFEVWLEGRQEVYILQASTKEIKNKWVLAIKRVLLNQLEELKEERKETIWRC